LNTLERLQKVYPVPTFVANAIINDTKEQFIMALKYNFPLNSAQKVHNRLLASRTNLTVNNDQILSVLPVNQNLPEIMDEFVHDKTFQNENLERETKMVSMMINRKINPAYDKYQWSKAFEIVIL
jgi:hypothetical protein